LDNQHQLSSCRGNKWTYIVVANGYNGSIATVQEFEGNLWEKSDTIKGGQWATQHTDSNLQVRH